jgi:hypothetical protein
VDYFTVARRRAFVTRHSSSASTTTTTTTRTHKESLDCPDADGLFTAQDRAFLTTRLLKQVTVVDAHDDSGATPTTNALTQLLETAYQTKYRKSVDLVGSQRHSATSSSSSSRSSDHKNENTTTMQEHGAQSETLWHVLTSLDWVDCVTTVHQPDLRDRVVSATTLAPWRQVAPPVDLIHDYVCTVVCCMVYVFVVVVVSCLLCKSVQLSSRLWI